MELKLVDMKVVKKASWWVEQTALKLVVESAEKSDELLGTKSVVLMADTMVEPKAGMTVDLTAGSLVGSLAA